MISSERKCFQKFFSIFSDHLSDFRGLAGRRCKIQRSDTIQLAAEVCGELKLTSLTGPSSSTANLCRDLTKASAQVTLHTILLGVEGVIYTPQTLKPLKKLGLDTHTATRLALKLHAHSVQYAYKLASTRRTLGKTPLNSRHQNQARATASNPPDPH
eukprot:1146838-Pelagomonas_calceolata.AAC.1